MKFIGINLLGLRPGECGESSGTETTLLPLNSLTSISYGEFKESGIFKVIFSWKEGKITGYADVEQMITMETLVSEQLSTDSESIQFINLWVVMEQHPVYLAFGKCVRESNP